MPSKMHNSASDVLWLKGQQTAPAVLVIRLGTTPTRKGAIPYACTCRCHRVKDSTLTDWEEEHADWSSRDW